MNAKLQYFFFVFASILTYGQVSVVSDVSKRELNGKETFVLTIVQEIIGSENVPETPLRMPDLSKFNKVAEGSVRNMFEDPQTKVLVRQLVYEYVLEPKQPGKILIGSALITVNGKIYKSEPFYINVKEGDFSKKALADNPSDGVYLNMELQDTEVYRNQPTIVIVRAYSKDFNDLRRFGKVSFPHRDGVEVISVSYERSEIQQRANMASQVIAKATVIPNSEGKINLPAASVTFNEGGNRTEKIQSNPVKLNVKKLPDNAPKSYDNAVGHYHLSLSQSPPSDRIEVNKPIDIQVKLKGEGNIDASQLPKIVKSENYTLYQPKITSHLREHRHGMKGEVIAQYVLIPKKSGEIDIATEAFSYFSPQKHRYVEVGASTLRITVLSPEQIANAKTTIEKVNELTNNVLDNVNTPIVEVKKYKIQEKEKINWKTLLGNYSLIGIFFILMLFILSRYRKYKRMKPRTENISLGSVAETEAELRKKMVIDLEAGIAFLGKQYEEGDKTAFFTALESLKNDAERWVSMKYQKTLKQYFETAKGNTIAEEYQHLLHQIEIEKYAPFSEKENLKQLLDKAIKLFSDIA